jgi:hypothetical protein
MVAAAMQPATATKAWPASVFARLDDQREEWCGFHVDWIETVSPEEIDRAFQGATAELLAINSQLFVLGRDQQNQSAAPRGTHTCHRRRPGDAMTFFHQSRLRLFWWVL